MLNFSTAYLENMKNKFISLTLGSGKCLLREVVCRYSVLYLQILDLDADSNLIDGFLSKLINLLVTPM